MFTLMYSEVAWVLVSSGTHVQPQIILDPDYIADYLSVLTTMVKSVIATSVAEFDLVKN